MKPLRPIALMAAAAALSACSTVSRIGDAINPFDGDDAPPQTAPRGRPHLDPRVRTAARRPIRRWRARTIRCRRRSR